MTEQFSNGKKRVKVETMVRCPCGQQVVIGIDEDGCSGVFHHMPMCKQFDALDPVQYVTFLRHYYQAQEQPRRMRPRKCSN